MHLFKTYNFSSLVFCRYNAGIFCLSTTYNDEDSGCEEEEEQDCDPQPAGVHTGLSGSC